MPSYIKFTLFFLFSFPIIAQHTQVLDVDSFQSSFRAETHKQLLDIRSHEKFAKGHIKNAVNIDFESDDFEKLVTAYFNKGQSIYIYAGSDFSSGNAQVFLKDLGFTKIKCLAGGFSEWVSKSKPYVSSYDNFEPIAAFTPTNFEKTIASNRLVFVYLKTPSCVYCKKMDSFLPKKVSDYNYRLLKIDIEENENMSYFFDAHETPTMLIFKNKKQIWKTTGQMDENELSQILLRYYQ